MRLSKKVLIVVLISGIIAVGIWIVQGDFFEDQIPSRAKKVLRISRDLDGQ